MRIFVRNIILVLISSHGYAQHNKDTGTVEVNGIEMYYEVYGEGEPLILLHGWTQSSKFWDDYLPIYAKYFKVYALDLRGHGRTSQVTTEFTIEKSSKDVLAFMDSLKINKVNVIGLSYGGLTLLELAAFKPERLKRIILIGTSPVYNGGENSQDNNAFSYDNLPTTYLEELHKIHHFGTSQVRALFNPSLNYEINLSNEKLKTFNFRTLIIQGDRDEILGVDPAIALHKNIPNSELWIVPNTGHIAIIGQNKKKFLTKSLQFLLKDNNKKDTNEE